MIGGTVKDFMFGLIIIFVLSLLLGEFFSRIILRFTKRKSPKIFIVSFAIALLCILELINVIKNLLPLDISSNSLFLIGLIILSIAAIIFIIFIFRERTYKKRQRKKLSIDNEWHYNAIVINSLYLFIGITILLFLFFAIQGFYALLSQFTILAISSYALLVIILLAFDIKVPFKYKVNLHKIEFYWPFRSPDVRKVNEGYLRLFQGLRLSHPQGFKEARVICYPRVVDLEKMYSYWLSQDADFGGSFFVMKNGDIIVTDLLGWDYRNRLFQILPQTKNCWMTKAKTQD